MNPLRNAILSNLCKNPNCDFCNDVRKNLGEPPITNSPKTSPSEMKVDASTSADSAAEQIKKAVAAAGLDVDIVAAEDDDEPTTAPEFLEAALGHMLDRAATYDKPEGERSMIQTVEAFNAITGRDLTEAEGWLLLQILKDVRLFTSPEFHQDSAEDCIAYAALKAEAKAAE